MDYRDELAAYLPQNEQEQRDKEAILAFAGTFPESALTRENAVAHLTSSGFIMDEALTKVLLVHHNIRGAWGWTGGHADGDGDLAAVALREAKEETGLREVRLVGGLLSLDVLPVWGHVKNGRYVSTHLHLSAAYLLLADPAAPVHPKTDENSGVRWFFVEEFTEQNFDEHDVYLYNKLIQRARHMRDIKRGEVCTHKG